MKRFTMRSFRRIAIPLMAFTLGAMPVAQTKASTLYAFAQQKVYNMTISPVNGIQNLNPVGSLAISSSTMSTLQGYPGAASNFPSIDANQSKSGVFLSGLVTNPPENYIGPPVNANPVQAINVLQAANPTPVGNANALTTNTIPSTTFNPNDMFTRSDVFTSSPSGNPIPGSNPLQGQPPANYNLNGSNIPSSEIFAQPGNSTTMSFDTVAEGKLTASGVLSGNSSSNWIVTGAFSLAAADQVVLNFQFAERLVTYSDTTPSDIVSASNSFTFSIIGPNPTNDAFGASSVRDWFNPIAGDAIYNRNSNGIVNILPGINGVDTTSFTSGQLAAGNYTFTIQGVSRIQLQTSAVPEPSTYALMGIATSTFSGLAYKRRKQQKTAFATA